MSQRTPEIGVRIALGAGTRHIMSLVLREAVAIAVIGAVIGLPAAHATSRAFAALVFGIKPTDLFTYSASAAGLMVVALAANYAPAHRATRVDPLVALRAE